jgi:hypothetical protein
MPSKPEQNRMDVARHRERIRSAGFVRVDLSVPAEDAAEIRAIAAQMRARKASKAPPTP